MADEGEGGSNIEAIEKLDTQIAKAKELLKLRQEDAQLLDDYNDQLRIQTELREKDLTLMSQTLDSQKKLLKKATNSAEIRAALGADLAEELTQRISDSEEELDYQTEALKLLNEKIKLNAEDRAQQELIRKTINQTEKSVGGIAGKLGIATKFSKTAVGQFADMALNLKQSGKGAEIVSEALKTTLSPANLAASLLSKMKESVVAIALALDLANSKFKRTTGFAGDFRGVMTDISQAGLLSGVSIEDAGAAMGSLTNNFSAFNPAATETNARLGETAALLAKTGVSADVSAGTMDFFTRAMGMSATASADLTRELALAGTGIGITTNKMLSDFQKLNGYLIGFGDRSTVVFKNLQAQAKATGISIDSLVGIAKKFDAFDTAAQSAGQLNAVLGTNLSTIDMLNATTDQRLSMLAQEIQMSTGGFKNLDRYTQMYVAQSIGAKDAAEAERLLNIARNPAELAKYNSEMQASAMRQEQLADLTAQMVPIMEQFKIAVMGLGLALEPLIYGLGFVFDVLGKTIQNFVAIINYSDATRIAFTALGVVLATYLLYGPVVAMLGLLAKGIAAVGLASKLAATGGLLGLAVLLISLVQILAMRINPVFVAAFHFMAVGIRMLGMAFAAVPTKALAAILAFSLLAATVALLVYGIKEMLSLLINNIDILPQLAVSLLAVGYAFSVFGAGVLTGATALGMALPMLVMAAPVLGLIAVAAMGIGIGFDMMGEGLIKMGTGLAAVVAGLSVVESLTNDDGFFAITTDGGKTSMVSAKGGVLTNFSSENISVDVKIPEIKVPAPIVHVYIDGKEIRKMVRREFANANGG